uniref:Coiled-coil domain containing 146 n=1 Tax=Gadus morhua TaxID=8049 RepID=A0A8C5FAA3_GADMO
MKCEEQLMEKELLLDQVTRLSQPIRDQLENGQQERLQMAKKARDKKDKVTPRLMAVAAELSMRQAQALALEQEVRERKEQVSTPPAAARRLEGFSKGGPGAQEREEVNRTQIHMHACTIREGEEAWNQLPGGVFTTAEPRPNAYIHSQGRLPLPRPYGAPGPFKPTEPGANMRHIRKPRLKPIEK